MSGIPVVLSDTLAPAAFRGLEMQGACQPDRRPQHPVTSTAHEKSWPLATSPCASKDQLVSESSRLPRGITHAEARPGGESQRIRAKNPPRLLWSQRFAPSVPTKTRPAKDHHSTFTDRSDAFAPVRLSWMPAEGPQGLVQAACRAAHLSLATRIKKADRGHLKPP
jgi:hypothetical protein